MTTETNWQPRFIAYAATHGRTPENQLEHDSGQFPGGKMCGFILWIADRRRAFKAAQPAAFIGDTLLDQGAFTEFLAK